MKTIVVLPAYNASRTLERTIRDIPFSYVQEIILVDDASKDETLQTAHHLVRTHPQLTLSEHEVQEGKVLVTVHEHPHNRGYGGNQKTCYTLALEHAADIVVMLHPDYQYDPKIVKYFVQFMEDGYFKVMLGSRIRTRAEALAGGMPLYKYVANRCLTLIQNMATGRSLSEWHTGMRAYTREVLEAIPYHTFSEDFVFDTQALLSIVERGFPIGEIPVPVRYFEEASSINFTRSVRYGLLTLLETGKFVVRTLDRRVRYIIAGGLSVVTNLAVYAALLYGMHVWYAVAAFIGFWSGAIVSFTLQKCWAFGASSSTQLVREISSYLVLVAINAAINSTLLFALVHQLGMHALYANILSNALVAISSYFVYKRIIFTVPAVRKSMV